MDVMIREHLFKLKEFGDQDLALNTLADHKIAINGIKSKTLLGTKEDESSYLHSKLKAVGVWGYTYELDYKSAHQTPSIELHAELDRLKETLTDSRLTHFQCEHYVPLVVLPRKEEEEPTIEDEMNADSAIVEVEANGEKVIERQGLMISPNFEKDQVSIKCIMGALTAVLPRADTWRWRLTREGRDATWFTLHVIPTDLITEDQLYTFQGLLSAKCQLHKIVAYPHELAIVMYSTTSFNVHPYTYSARAKQAKWVEFNRAKRYKPYPRARPYDKPK